MQNWKFGAFGLAIGAMLVFLPLAGKLGEARDQETRLSILMNITCSMPRDELEEKLKNVVTPKDIVAIERGQNEALWGRVKEQLLSECYD